MVNKGQSAGDGSGRAHDRRQRCPNRYDDPLYAGSGFQHRRDDLDPPRDLWVKIPGGNYAKINTAYSVGEIYQLPGGGPALAAKTVENLLGSRFIIMPRSTSKLSLTL